MNQKMLTALFMLVVGGTALTAQESAHVEDGVQWLHSLTEAQAQAKLENRVILLHFWSTTCPPCRKLEQTVFRRSDFGRSIGTNYIPVKINTRDDPASLARRFRIRRVPTDVYLTAEGAEVYRTISPQDPRAYIDCLENVAAQVRELKRPQSEAIAAVRHRAANFPPGSTFQAEKPEAAQTAEKITTGSRYSNDRLASQSRVNNPHFTATHQTGELNNQDEDSVLVANRPTPHAARNSAVQHQITDLEEFALLGYCPVTLVDEMKWEPGDRRWGAVHEGQTFLFTSRENQRMFLANHQRFAPAFRGFDPVIFYATGRFVAGQCEFGVVYGETYFLFAGEESLEHFWNHPETYEKTVRQVMARSKQRR
jgi:protein disulfide-isomerase